MDLKEIMAIAGKPGLYKLVGQAKNGIIVESIVDQKRFQAFTHEKISSLEEISIFTESEDKPLKEILKAFYEKLETKPAPDFKNDNTGLKEFFNKMIPDYDKERVYVSHMQKVVSWYNLLLQHDLLDFTEEAQAAEPESTDDAAEASVDPDTGNAEAEA
ncbi:MAG: DUF5606 domain-containing protein [Lentimicrobium sp.]|jgi:hypothetical protein|nr:DUF5606 domain-containing protein [Lentimicrobium sp.]